MTNMILSAMSNAAQLSLCLVILILLIAADVIAILGLFQWKKKVFKSLDEDAAQATNVNADASMENMASSAQEETQTQPAADTQTEQQEAVAPQTEVGAEPTDAQTDNAVSQPVETQGVAVENSNSQSVEAETPVDAQQEQQNVAQADDKKQSGMSAFMFAPFMMISAASSVPALRTMVYMLGALALAASIGAIVIAAIFAKQISDKLAKMPKPQQAVEEPPVEETQPTQEVEPQPVEEAQPEPQVVEEPTPVVEEAAPIVEEPVATPVEEPVAESDDDDEEEDEGPIFVETDDGVGYFIILEKSFTARIIQSKKEVKEFYSQIKNEFLSYKKVAARMSKKRESFRFGKTTIAKLAIRGKTLKLYLALDPSKYIDGRYKIEDESDVVSMADTPLLLKINSDRKCEYAMELIEDLMAKNDVIPDDKFKEVDYVAEMPYETTDALVEKGLIVKKLAKGTSLFDSQVVDVHVPESQQAVEEPVVETQPAVEENKEDIYERSFSAKLMQTTDEFKKYYSQIKNAILSYAKINARMSKKREAFRIGTKDCVASMKIKDDALRLYLALDVKDYEGRDFKVIDKSAIQTLGDETPLLYIIKGKADVAIAKQLVDDLATKLGLEKSGKANVDYAKKFPYMTDEELFEQGLIVMKQVVGTSFADYQEQSEVAADTVSGAEKKPAPKKSSTAAKKPVAKTSTSTAKKPATKTASAATKKPAASTTAKKPTAASTAKKPAAKK